MFGAKRRWLAAERWWPGLAGPDSYVDKRPGFFSLSVRGRVLLVLLILALNALFTRQEVANAWHPAPECRMIRPRSGATRTWAARADSAGAGGGVHEFRFLS